MGRIDNPPPRNQFELSELEDRTPKDTHTLFQDRLARTACNRARLQNSLANEAARVPVPQPSVIQARRFAPVLTASLRRLVAELNEAIRNRGRVDDSQLVRVALIAAERALSDAASFTEESDGTGMA